MKTSTLSSTELIDKVMNARSMRDVFTQMDKFEETYTAYMKILHPDRCTDPGAGEAVARLNTWRDELKKGLKATFDGLSVVVTNDAISYEGTSAILRWSCDNYNKLVALKQPDFNGFFPYLPKRVIMDDNKVPTKVVNIIPYRVLQLSTLYPLPEEHVRWVLNRMLEFSTWMNQAGYVHAGISPESIYVAPHNHGLICASFHHMQRVGAKLATISGKWSNFYPAQVFKNKQALSNIDIELSKKTAIWLLGDKSGMGNTLRGKIDDEFLHFLQKKSFSPYETITEYKEFIKRKYKSQFYELHV